MNRNQWESEIDALLEGDLDASAAEELKAAASEDARLAAAIIDAHRIQSELENLGLERAPKSLQKRLRRIPREYPKTRSFPGLGWATAATAALALVLAIGIQRPAPPSEADLYKARKELALAFSYLNAYGLQVQREIKQEIGGQLREAIASPERPATGGNQSFSSGV